VTRLAAFLALLLVAGAVRPDVERSWLFFVSGLPAFPQGTFIGPFQTKKGCESERRVWEADDTRPDEVVVGPACEAGPLRSRWLL
jgi:hypothetical protein